MCISVFRIGARGTDVWTRPHWESRMGTNYRFVAYGTVIFALCAILLTWISHFGRTGSKAQPPKTVAIPSADYNPLRTPRPAPSASGDSPSQTSTPFYSPHEDQRSSAEPDARSAHQPSNPEVGAPPDDQFLPPSFSTSSEGEVSPPDSDQNSSPSKGESAEQRFIRRLKRH